jgi:hypothetical protein
MRPFFFKRLIVISLVAGIVLSSCKKKSPDPLPTYVVPTTYNFENVDFSNQKDRRRMLDDMLDYMKLARTAGVRIDAQKLKNMFSNTGNPYDKEDLNTGGKQIRSKTFEADIPVIEALFDQAATASQSNSPASNGTAGLSISSDGSKTYLLTANGIDITELVEKSIMGATFYYQATAISLSDSEVGDAVDNTTLTKNGTPMEHHWDEAFGYLGVPKTFSSATKEKDVDFWGVYLLKREELMGSATKLMNAFLEGRAAISNKNMTAKNAAIPVILGEWEKVSAASAISYLNRAKASMNDNAVRNHALTAAIGLIRALKYNPSKKITQAQIDEAISNIGQNLYGTTLANLDKTRDLLANVYNMNDIKNNL